MAPSRKFPCATMRVVENIFQAQLSSARQRRSASSFFFRPSRDLATFVSTASLRISLSFFMLYPRSSCREGCGCVGRARNCASGWHANAGRSRGVYFGTPPRARSRGRSRSQRVMPHTFSRSAVQTRGSDARSCTHEQHISVRRRFVYRRQQDRGRTLWSCVNSARHAAI